MSPQSRVKEESKTFLISMSFRSGKAVHKVVSVHVYVHAHVCACTYTHMHAHHLVECLHAVSQDFDFIGQWEEFLAVPPWASYHRRHEAFSWTLQAPPGVLSPESPPKQEASTDSTQPWAPI